MVSLCYKASRVSTERTADFEQVLSNRGYSARVLSDQEAFNSTLAMKERYKCTHKV